MTALFAKKVGRGEISVINFSIIRLLAFVAPGNFILHLGSS